MLFAVALAVLSQTPAQVAVIDISAEDAIYEDVSRRYAQALVDALSKEGLSAVRVDESELPPQGCRLGPCLGVAARAKGALVVVTMMRATNGEPLAGGRYELKAGVKKSPKGLTSFLAQAKKAMTKVVPAP